MAIIRVASSSAATYDPVTVIKPTGTINDDVMVAFVHSTGGFPTTVPTGWTMLQQNNSGSGNPAYLSTYYRVAASEGASYVWSRGTPGVNYLLAVIATYRGADPTPIEVNSQTNAAASSAINATSITTSSANAMILWATATNNSDPSFSPVITVPTALAKISQKDIGAPFAVNTLAVADGLLVTPGATGAAYNNGTQVQALVNAIHLLALKPAATHAITSSTNAKFGLTSGTLFGSVRRTGTAISLGAGDFTCEAWVYWANNGSAQVLFDWGGSGAGTTPKIDINTSGNVRWISAGATQLTTSNAITPNVWTHVAIVRLAGVISIYISGMSGGTFSSGTTYTTTTQFAVGMDYFAGTGAFAGFIDEARIAVGTAFYVADFPPPTGTFPDTIIATGTGYVLQKNLGHIIVH